MEKMICIKNHPALQFCASKITLRQFSTRQRPHVKGHTPKSKSQNSRVTVPWDKHSVRHKTSTIKFLGCSGTPSTAAIYAADFQ
jgi:hypothetical protein